MTPNGRWIEDLPLTGAAFRHLQWRVAGAGSDRIRSTAALLSAAYAAREHRETDEYRRGLAAARSDYFEQFSIHVDRKETVQ